ncbi:hypothetical protein TPB0596_19530 [Tsukamurella pulmonis]|uniref:hypothetical protein n=1 Tax=Tsukamurella pulmonis TaxID=47312 RepID=UPI001EDE8999|nr:hypothetical protein [Tsukamurella pulmonis]BDD82190.1 hypothetical protein TPB0596_19530 [Tsukamurella pulmonis]
MPDLQPLVAAQIIPPERAPDYLRAMDIAVEDLYSAISAGQATAGEFDRFAPLTAPGLLRWFGVVAELRRRLAATGRWYPDDRRGQPLSRHRESRRTLTVMSGDVSTGSPHSAFGPHTVRRKGRATADSLQPDEALFPLAAFAPPPRVDGVLAGAWVLLYRDDGAAIRLEVSQPAGFDSDSGQFTGWTVRVLLDDCRPAERKGLGGATDLQLFRSVA